MKIVLLHSSKLPFFINNVYLTNHCHHNCRFGTGQARYELKKPDWPGPHDTDVPTFTTYGRKT